MDFSSSRYQKRTSPSTTSGRVREDRFQARQTRPSSGEKPQNISPREVSQRKTPSENTGLQRLLDAAKIIRVLDLDKLNKEYEELLHNNKSSDNEVIEQLKEKDGEIRQLQENKLQWEELEKGLKAENDRLKSALKGKEEDLKKRKQQLEEMEKTINEYINRLDGDTTKSQKSRIRQLERELEESKKELEKKKEEHKQWLQTTEAMQWETEKEKTNLQDQLEQQKRREKEMSKKLYEEELKVKMAHSEKAEALNRLSKEMGTKLNDNNPAIADLSDPNRATKLAEMYNELYDNEWTDALEILESKYGKESEEAAIRLLLDIVKKAYTFCSEKAQKQIKELEKIFFTQKCSESSDMRMVSKLFKDQRKSNAEEIAKDIYEEFIKNHENRVAYLVVEYVKKVMRLCWLMNVQDPPVVLGKEAVSCDVMDLELYRAYTTTGKTVSYTVWLPLLLHDGGALLSKGVAQPVKEERIRAKSAPARNRTRDPKSNINTYLYADKSAADTHSSPDERWVTNQIGGRKEYSPRSRQTKAGGDVEAERNDYSPKSRHGYEDDDDASKLLAMHIKSTAYESVGHPKATWESPSVNSVQRKYETGTQHKSYGGKYNVSPDYGQVTTHSRDSPTAGYDHYTYKDYTPSQQSNYQQTLHSTSGKGKLSQGIPNQPTGNTYSPGRLSRHRNYDYDFSKTYVRKY